MMVVKNFARSVMVVGVLALSQAVAMAGPKAETRYATRQAVPIIASGAPDSEESFRRRRLGDGSIAGSDQRLSPQAPVAEGAIWARWSAEGFLRYLIGPGVIPHEARYVVE